MQHEDASRLHDRPRYRRCKREKKTDERILDFVTYSIFEGSEKCEYSVGAVETLFYPDDGGEGVRCPTCGVAWFDGQDYCTTFCEHLRFILCTYDQPAFVYTFPDGDVTHLVVETLSWIDMLVTRMSEEGCYIDVDSSILEHLAKYRTRLASHCLVLEYKPEPPEPGSFITVYGYQSDEKSRSWTATEFRTPHRS